MNRTIETELLSLEVQKSLEILDQDDSVNKLSDDIIILNQKLEKFQVHLDKCLESFFDLFSLLFSNIFSIIT